MITRSGLEIDYSPKRMVEACEQFFLLLNRIATTDDLGDVEGFRTLVIAALEEFEKKCRSIEFSGEETDEAKYALVVFLDETILYSHWSEKEQWAKLPLQLQFYGNNKGGTQFFDKIEIIKKSDYKTSDLLEIYYICLVLGFEGKYKVLGREPLLSVMADIERDLKVTPGQLTALSPSCRCTEEFRKDSSGDIYKWLIPAVSLITVLIIFVLLFFLSNSIADKAVHQITEVKVM
ncbi:MAG: DotU family type IV/VI secretion system protein [Nitrospirae bacterium]|nr:DotU family type IV/VI secretion system protein [Nitrospirota bacterium]